ncbi:MAG: hypothetical protein IBX45_10500 [Campylobacterales bacterium]|nr:hypothetical protein [Campylobacterales bacterium]
MFKTTLLLCLAILFSGCATKAPYVAPTEGPTATLILPVSFTKYSFGFSGASVHFAIGDASGFGKPHEAKRDTKEQETVTYKIPANKDVYIHYHAYIRNTSCYATKIITNVEEGKIYEAKGTMTWSGRDLRHHCTLVVIEKSGQKRFL